VEGGGGGRGRGWEGREREGGREGVGEGVERGWGREGGERGRVFAEGLTVWGRVEGLCQGSHCLGEC